MITMKKLTRLTPLTFLLTLVLGQGLFHAELSFAGEGAGVRGGGGIQCADGRRGTLESFEFDPKFEKQKTLDPTRLTGNFLNELEIHDPVLAHKTEERLLRFGDVHSWPILPSRTVPSEMGNVSWFWGFLTENPYARAPRTLSKNLRAWDEKLTNFFPEECAFYQISILENGSPKMLPGSMEFLSGPLEERLIALHEALYSVLIDESNLTNPILVRNLITAILNRLVNPATPSFEIDHTLSAIHHFSENKVKTLSSWAPYTSQVMVRTQVYTKFILGQNTRDGTFVENQWVVSGSPDDVCPESVTFDFDGLESLVVSTHSKRLNPILNESPFVKNTVLLKTQDFSSGYDTLRRLSSTAVALNRRKNSGQDPWTVYDFQPKHLIITTLRPRETRNRENGLKITELRKLYARARVRCEYDAHWTHDMDSLLWERIWGEVEW